MTQMKSNSTAPSLHAGPRRQGPNVAVQGTAPGRPASHAFVVPVVRELTPRPGRRSAGSAAW